MIRQGYKPTVSAIVLNDENKVLMTHNKSHGADFWKLPQGGVEENETLESAILREMGEEVNSNAFEILKKCEIEYKYDWPQDVQERKGFLGPRLTFFILRCTDEGSLKPNKEELDGLKWIKLDNMPSFSISLPEFKDTIQKLTNEVEELLSK